MSLIRFKRIFLIECTCNSYARCSNFSDPTACFFTKLTAICMESNQLLLLLLHVIFWMTEKTDIRMYCPTHIVIPIMNLLFKLI